MFGRSTLKSRTATTSTTTKESPRTKPPTPRTAANGGTEHDGSNDAASAAESNTTAKSASSSSSSNGVASVYRSSSTSALIPGPSHSTHAQPTFAQPLNRTASSAASSTNAFPKSPSRGSTAAANAAGLASTAPASSLRRSSSMSQSSSSSLLSPTSAAKSRTLATRQTPASAPNGTQSHSSGPTSPRPDLSSTTSKNQPQYNDPTLSDAERLLLQMHRAFHASLNAPPHAAQMDALDGLHQAPPAADSFTAFPPFLGPILEMMKSEFHSSLQSARASLVEDLRDPSNVDKLDAHFIKEMRESYSLLRKDVEIQNELMSQEITRLREQLAAEARRAREAEENVFKILFELQSFQSGVYSELDRIRALANIPNPPMIQSSFPMAQPQQYHVPSDFPSHPPAHGPEHMISALRPVMSDPLPQPQSVGAGSALQPTTLIADPVTGDYRPDPQLKQILEESRMKLQDEIAVLRNRLEQAVKSDQQPPQETVQEIGLRRVSTAEPSRGRSNSEPVSFADIDDLRRRYEMEQRFDELLQKSRADESPESASHAVDLVMNAPISPEDDEYPDVWDDEDYTCPLITLPVPITQLLQRQPRQSALKRRSLPPEQTTLDGPNSLSGDSQSQPPQHASSARNVRFGESVKTHDGSDPNANMFSSFGMFRAMFLGQPNAQAAPPMDPPVNAMEYHANVGADSFTSAGQRQFGSFAESPI